MKFEKGKSNWFPGHMNLTKYLIKSCLSQVDLVINLVDARAPMASTNFSILKWVKNKPIVVFLGKIDLANESITKDWLDYFKIELGYFAVAVNCRNFNSVKKSFDLACEQFKKVKRSRFNSNMIRIMVVGVSNVGKSTLINSAVGSKKVKVENRPGVTKSKQWVVLNGGMSLLDMPGVLPLDVKNEEQNFCLQLIGVVKREEVDAENLSLYLLDFLYLTNLNFFEKNFSGKLQNFDNAFNWLKNFAEAKNMVLKGGKLDLLRASNFLINEFQRAKFGRFTLENPEFSINLKE